MESRENKKSPEIPERQQLLQAIQIGVNGDGEQRRSTVDRAPSTLANLVVELPEEYGKLSKTSPKHTCFDVVQTYVNSRRIFWLRQRTHIIKSTPRNIKVSTCCFIVAVALS
jgi:hypothetical protein